MQLERTYRYMHKVNSTTKNIEIYRSILSFNRLIDHLAKGFLSTVVEFDVPDATEKYCTQYSLILLSSPRDDI